MSFGKCPDKTKSKIITLALSSLLVLSIMANIAYVVAYANTALAQPQSTSSMPPNSIGVKINNNTNTNSSEQMHQQQPPKTHEYTLIAENTTLEIAPGLRVDAWTYNGTIPGPTLTATEGDRVILQKIL